MKVALISHVLPPSSSGQAMIIHRLLRDINPRSYCLISPERHEPGALVGSDALRLPGRYYHLPPASRLRRGHRMGLRFLREGINIPVAIVQQTNRLTDIVRREKCEAVVACTGDVTLLPAGYLASRRVGVPFYAYIFDHYSYREWHDPVAAFWARRLEPLLMKRAAAVITPNETLRDDLHERFGVEAVVIHNSFDITPYMTNGQPVQPTPADGVKIVYTGDVYEAHYDAFRNLISAIESLGRSDVRLHLYTDRPAKLLDEQKIRGPVAHHPHQEPGAIPRIQMEADILFMPLAFESPYPDLVRTSATTKLGEYLAAGRPVLVHAPADSFVSGYFRRHGCGLVVDKNDPARLATAIEQLLSDADLRRTLVAKAWERARADFDLTVACARFAELLKLERDESSLGVS